MAAMQLCVAALETRHGSPPTSPDADHHEWTLGVFLAGRSRIGV